MNIHLRKFRCFIYFIGRCLLALLMETIEQNNDFAFIKYEEYTEDVPSIFGTQFIKTVSNEFYEFLGKPILSLEQEKPILYLLLLLFFQGTHECLKVTAVCQYPPCHDAKIVEVA